MVVRAEPLLGDGSTQPRVHAERRAVPLARALRAEDRQRERLGEAPQDEGSTGNLGLLGGNDGGDPGGLSLIPNLNIVTPANDWLAFGLSVSPTYGLVTDYDDGWQGRYHALESRLSTVNINPAVSFRLDKVISVGGGVNFQHASATLSTAIDFGTIGQLMLGSQTAGQLGLWYESNDGMVEVEGDSWGWGFNFGVLFEVTESTRFGFAYRSKISHKLEGTGDFTVPAEAMALTQTGLFTDSDASARITLPEQASISWYQDLGCNWAFLADATWTNWSRFEELRVNFESSQPDNATTEDWHSTWRFAIGTVWRPTKDWSFRVGAAYDESPIPNNRRTVRIPTNDRYWLTFGIGYRVTEWMTLDFSYMHVFIEDAEIDETSSTGQRLVGTVEGSADVFGFQVTVAF